MIWYLFCLEVMYSKIGLTDLGKLSNGGLSDRYYDCSLIWDIKFDS